MSKKYEMTRSLASSHCCNYLYLTPSCVPADGALKTCYLDFVCSEADESRELSCWNFDLYTGGLSHNFYTTGDY